MSVGTSHTERVAGRSRRRVLLFAVGFSAAVAGVDVLDGNPHTAQSGAVLALALVLIATGLWLPRR